MISKSTRIFRWILCSLLLICIIAFIIIYQDEVVYEANIFDISPIQDHDKPKKIGLYYDGYDFLQISDEAYEKIISQAPLDKSRTVFFEKIASKKYPHKHPIRIYFYKNTGIFDRVEILDE